MLKDDVIEMAQKMADILAELNAMEEKYPTGIRYAGNVYAEVRKGYRVLLEECFGNGGADLIDQHVLDGARVRNAVSYLETGSHW